MKIIESKLADMTPTQVARLRKMTLASETSMMKSTLDITMGKAPRFPFPDRDGRLTKENVLIAIAQNQNKTWMAWALVRPWYAKQLIMVFVKPYYRRRGLGKRLVNFMRDKHEFDCYPWDSTSEFFFRNVKLRPYWLNRT